MSRRPSPRVAPVRPIAALALAAALVAPMQRGGAQQVYVSALNTSGQGAANQLGRFDLTTGSYTLIGATAAAYTALTAGNDGYLYGVGPGSALHRIDPLTAAVTAIGTFGSTFLTGLAQDGGTLLGKQNGGTAALYTVDPATATLSNARGALGNADQSDNLERTSDGLLYYGGQLDGNPNSWALFTVDASSGARTLVGSLPSARDVRALSDGGAALLYGFGACPAGTPGGRNCVLEISRATGAISGTARSAGLLVLAAANAPGAGGGPVSTVPEPSTLALLAGGLAAVVVRARRRATR